MKIKRISNGTSGKIGICIIRWVVFALIAFVVLMPVYWIFISSITPPGELFKSPIEYLPKHPSLESYQFLVSHVGLLEKIRNTIIIIGVTLIVGTFICILGAYGFYRFRDRKGVNLAFLFIVATMLIPEVVTARPLYEFMRKVGLFDTYPGLIILYISSIVPFTILILRGFVGEIPVVLEEAAAIDGAGFWQRMRYIILPLMKPAIAVQMVFTFVSSWNNYFTPALILKDKAKKTLPILLAELRGADFMKFDMGQVYAMIAFSIFPVIIVYLFLSRYIVGGVTAGGVKE